MKRSVLVNCVLKKKNKTKPVSAGLFLPGAVENDYTSLLRASYNFRMSKTDVSS